MKAGVTKERFIEKYSELLFMTREGVSHLELLEDDYVNIVYNNGYKRKVDIACNSAMAIIRDIARHV
jgi:hypothetical protein